MTPEGGTWEQWMAALEELDQALPERAHPSCPNCGRRELRAQYIGDPTGSGTPRSVVTTATGAPTPAGRDPSGCCWLTREDFAGGGVGERSLLNCVAMVKFSVCTVPLCTPRAFTRRRWGSDSRRVSVLGCGDALDSTVDWAKGTISGRDLLFQAGTTLVLSVVGGAAAKAGVKALERLGPKLHGWIDDALKPRLADERGTWSMADRLSPSGAPTRPRDLLDADGQRRWARAAYDSFLTDDRDIDTISRALAQVRRPDGTTGYSPEEIAAVKRT